MMNIDKRVILSIFFFTTLLYNQVNAQEYVWEFDKVLEREKNEPLRKDSILNHLKNKWEISIGYGPFYHTSFYKKDVANTAFGFPNKMNQWQFAIAWHPYEKLVLDIKLEYRVVKDIPQKPSISSVINGDEIEMEGEGGGMIPVLIGMKYYLFKTRFRLYVGISGGFCKVKSQYTQVQGNIYDGINRTDIKQEETVKIIGFESGIEYRLGKRVNVGIGVQYQHSEPFKEMDIGYDRLSGFSITPRISVLLF